MNRLDTQRLASFSHMEEGVAADWKIIGDAINEFSRQLPDRILRHLCLLDGDYRGFPVDGLTHCLQTATLAYRDGKDEEYVVCALLHDIGDTLGPYDHAGVAASLLKPFVSDDNYWMVKHHTIFQGYYYFGYFGLDRNLRDQYRGQPAYERTLEFVTKYDSRAFDKNAETLPLALFEPMVRRVMSAPHHAMFRPTANAGKQATAP